MTTNTTAAKTPKACRRCSGKGIIAAYVDVKAGGTCARCYGTGIDPGKTIEKTTTVNGTTIRLAGNNARQVVEVGTEVTYFTSMDEARRFANEAYRNAKEA